MTRTVGWVIGQVLAVVVALVVAFSLPPKNPEASKRYYARGGRHEPIHGEHVRPFLYGGAALALLAAGWQFLASGKDDELLEALDKVTPVPLKDASPGMYVAVKGRVTADDHLLAPRARERVVWYRYRQTEEWEVQNGDGAWIHQERVHSDDSEMVPFYLTEGSARVEVAPGKARVEARRLHREAVGAGGSMSDVGGRSAMPGTKGGYRGHKYVHEVHGVQHDTEVFVMGQVGEGLGGVPRIEAAGRGEGQPFLVSSRPPDELRQILEENTSAGSLLMVAFGLLGLVLGVAGAMVPSGALF